MSGGDAVVIGIGNPYCGDDGVGLVIIERLQARRLRGVDVVEETGEPAGLINRWTNRSLAVIVDAASSGAGPGTIHRIVHSDDLWSRRSETRAASSHSLGIGTAVALGRALGRLPERLVVFAVEAGDVRGGLGLSAAVAAAVDDVLDAIVAEVGVSVKVTP